MALRLILNETSYHGEGAIKNLGSEIKKRSFKKCLLCCDSGLIKIGLAKKVTDELDRGNISYEVFFDIKPNPTISNVKNGLNALHQAKADCIIALGGGSSIDTAKAIGIIATNPEHCDVVSLEGLSNTKNKSLPVICIPTTAGTAAEVTINYVITDEESNKKMVCVDPNTIPILALVDPEMMSSMPVSLTAATGMDALTHAIEGYITKGSSEITDMFHLKAIELIARSLKKAVLGKMDGRRDMALAQYIAGMGFSNAGLGLVHAMAHPLGALYDTPHGLANAIILPVVMEYNALYTDEKYRNIAIAMGIDKARSLSLIEARKEAIELVKRLSLEVGIPTTLSGILKKEDIDFLAKSAFNDPCRSGNPRDTSIEDIKRLYLKLIN